MVAFNQDPSAYWPEHVEVEMCGSPFGTLHVCPELLEGRIAVFVLMGDEIPDLLCSYREKLLQKVGDRFGTVCYSLRMGGKHGLLFTKDLGAKMRNPRLLLKSARSDFVDCAHKALEEINAEP